jgi:hypothetical protein
LGSDGLETPSTKASKNVFAVIELEQGNSGWDVGQLVAKTAVEMERTFDGSDDGFDVGLDQGTKDGWDVGFS